VFKPRPDDPINDLPIAQVRLMRSLECSDRTMSELVNEFNTSASAITQLVHRLCEAGYAHATQDEADRRVRHVSLTPEGSQLMSLRRQHRLASAEALLTHVSDRDRASLMSVLEDLLAVAQSSKTPAPETLALTDEFEQILPSELHS
jgi:DNA-binding MarR family transcriptional regulator